MLFALAEQMVQCTGDALDVFACIATKMGDTILQLVGLMSTCMLHQLDLGLNLFRCHPSTS